MDTDIKDRVFFLQHSDLKWPFNDRGQPHLYLDTGKYGSQHTVDPFPCYAHERELVMSEIRDIESKIKLPFPPRYFIMPFEDGSRTNGWADGNQYHGENPQPYIVLQGKRIPLHPGMTRYLVSHEYGHVVQVNLQFFLKMKWEEFCEFYAKEVRRIPYEKSYGGMRWHMNTGEVIANDVRVAVLNKEPEFWPHEAVHPWAAPHIGAWWREQFDKHFTPKPAEPAPETNQPAAAAAQ